MEDFDKGAKKCTSCSTLFFDFGKSPIICPNCGATVNSLLTNVSKRGRPPKVNKVSEAEQQLETAVDKSSEDKSVNSEEVDVDVAVDVAVDVNIDSNDEDESVEEMIEIKRDEEA